jgi:hypothetical protein
VAASAIFFTTACYDLGPLAERASINPDELAALVLQKITNNHYGGGGAGTIIMVATGRKDGNDRPSIDSSSVTTSYEPAGNSRSTLAIRNGCLNTTVSRRDRVIVMIILARWRRGAAAADNSWHTEKKSTTTIPV